MWLWIARETQGLIGIPTAQALVTSVEPGATRVQLYAGVGGLGAGADPGPALMHNGKVEGARCGTVEFLFPHP